jgi:hypothetical protein
VLTLSRPYALAWRAEAAPSKPLARRPRRLRLAAALQAVETPDADYRFYQALAAALLRGRCRMCNRETRDMHDGVRLCAQLPCAGAYAAARAAGAAACAAAGLGGVPPGGAAAGGAAAPKRRAWRPRHAAQKKAAAKHAAAQRQAPH